MNKSEDGEFDNLLSFPPRPIVPKAIAEFIDEIIEEEIPEIVSIDQIEISSALEEKLRYLLGLIIICHNIGKTDTCMQCNQRVKAVEAIKVQIKAEMLSTYDMKRKLNKWQHENTLLKTWIDINNPMGTADSIIRQSNMKVEK